MGSIDVAKVITAAAQSSLGVLSLIILAVAFVGYNFFKRSGDGVKIGVFAVMLLAGLGFGVSVAREGRSQAKETPVAREPTPGPTMTAAPAARQVAATDISGRWHDADGYLYDIRVAGTVLSYAYSRGGVRLGTGRGTIVGDALEYAYTDARTGDGGTCTGIVASGGRRIEGSCASGGVRWGFAIVR